MTASLVLVGAALLCAGGGDPVRRRTGALTRSGRLQPRAHRDAARLSTHVIALIACGAVIAAALLAGFAIGFACAVIALTALSLVRGMRTGAAQQRRRSTLLAAVRSLVAELEAGTRPDVALRAAAELCPDHAAALRSGADAVARGDAAADFGHPELRPLGHAFDVAGQTGAPLAGVLSRVADDLEHAEARSQRLAALTAGPRASAVMLAALPLLGVLLGSSIGARPLHVLFATGGGRLLCCVGVVLDALGVVWTRRILRMAERQ